MGFRRSLPIPALLAGGALALSGLTPPATAAASPAAVAALTPATAAPVAGPTKDQAPVLRSPATVTLLTGEQVTLRPGPDGRPQVDVRDRDGGPAVGYAVHNDHGRVSVIPHDVASLVPGVLDPALFDVTGLVEMGYDDAHRADLPVIVRNSGARAMASSGFTATRTLAGIDATAGRIQKSRAAVFGDALTADHAAGPAKIWLDAALHADPVTKVAPVPATTTPSSGSTTAAAPLDGYLQQVQAPTAWRRGLDGHGVKVAILDSGIDTGQPALEGKVTATADFTGDGPQDDLGRGTQLASLVAGNGAGSDGARKGIAPGAELISGKVLNAAGQGTVSELIAAMEWAVDQHADLVNIGLGARAPIQGDDLLADELDRLTQSSGALFVTAAGDDGDIYASPFSIETPGTAASALTVGALDDAGNRARFTSMGPTHSFLQKPELSAPGTGILAARAGARDGNLYAMGFGTSRSASLVTGSAALLLQQHPDLTWQQLKARLSSSAVDSNSVFTGWSGSGRINLDIATSTDSLVPDVGWIDFGRVRHDDGTSQQRTLTLTNPSAEPVTLTFADRETTIWAKAAPDSAVVVSPATLTVPAGGTADATVTFDRTGLSDIVGNWNTLADNDWQGALDVIDSNGKRRLRLALNAYDEPPMHDLSVRVLDRAGKPVSGGYVNVFNSSDGHYSQLFLDEQGRGKTRITPGVYGAYSFVPTGDTTTFAIDANLTVANDTSFTLDARKAVQLKAPVVEGQPTTLTQGAVAYMRGKGKDEWQFDHLPVTAADLSAGRIYVTPTQAPSTGVAEAITRWQLEPTKKAHQDTPDVYEVYQSANRFNSPLVKPIDRKALRDMARVESTFGSTWGDGTQVLDRGVQSTFTQVGWSTRRTVNAPGHLVELLSAGPGITWWQCHKVPNTGNSGLCDDPYRTYKPGEKVRSMLGTALHPQLSVAGMQGGWFTVQVGLADANHIGVVDENRVGGQQLALYRNGALIDAVPTATGGFQVPAGAARWRVEHSWSSTAVPTSGQAKTAWEFAATSSDDPGASGTEPQLIRPSYDPSVAADGSTRAWRPMLFDLKLSYSDGAAVPVKSAKLLLSSDHGKTWTTAPLVRSAGGYRTVVAPWMLMPGRSLSVRTTVTDRSGGSVDQTVLDLVPVR
ncbi:S8 family serine peptidase [Kribbella sp. NPDC051586]|uniref:S8 family serine peptidase n=1 Tax=Kribbella sp. NPDC051586 TaxID=3364118 RepID=UPI0037A9FAFE